MTSPNRQLSTIALGDSAQAWTAAGFAVSADTPSTVVLGATVVRLTGRGGGVEGWALEGVEHPIDGLATAPPSPPASPTPHPNGITHIDHVVVRTGNQERTIEAFTAAGLQVRGGRSTSSYGSPMRQTFFWAGDVIVELVGPDDGEPTTDEPTTVFGLALVSQDLDATAAHLGPLLGTPKEAVQPGRRIAGLRHREAGIGVPIAVMSPHIRGAGPQATDG